MHSLLASLLVFGIALVSTTASANPVRYTYTGDNLTTSPGVGFDSTFETVGNAPAGLAFLSFTMIGDLGADRSLAQFTPSSWSISDGVHIYSSDAPPPHLNFYAKFSTSDAGEITDWYVQVSTYSDQPSADPYNDWDETLLRTSTDPSSLSVPYDESRLFSAVSGDFGREKDYRALSYGHPGSWAMEEVHIESIPEPSIFPLFGTALLGATLFRIRRSCSRYSLSGRPNSALSPA